ncbi:hypothetical protein [Litoribacillus peritrichatus]|uniref:Uncharacterized protein n=1 Tax=Litoribacillus peritrichatus TaxID=718191 RepID=A0ABP7M799_9GAMM
MKKLTLVILMILSTHVFSGECINCTIKFMGCSGKYLGKQSCSIYFNESISNKASCATGTDSGNRMVLDVSNEGEKGILSLAISAKLANQKVTVYGNNTCDIWTTHESINLLYIGEVK